MFIGPGGNYVTKLRDLVESGAIPFVSLGTAHLETTHEEGCGVFTDRPCRCDPTIEYLGVEVEGGEA